MKKDWDKTFLEIADIFANQSSCVKRKVGAVLVKDLRILSTGYNGTPSGFYNCEDVFTQGDGSVDLENGVFKGKMHTDQFGIVKTIRSHIYLNHHDFAERYEIHAEQNCLSFAAKNGVSTEDCILYITTAPCVNCAKIIIASGIKEVIYKDSYKNQDGINLLRDSKITVWQYGE